MNERIQELAVEAEDYADSIVDQGGEFHPAYTQKLAELMIVEFCDVVKSTANELNEHYFKQGASEEEVLMRVNGALAVLGHIRARFTD